MGIGVDIDFQFPDWAGALRASWPELKLFLAAQVQTNRGMMFDAEGADNGKPKWAPLKFRNGQILSDRGNLRKSWSPTPPRGVPGDDGIVEWSGDVLTVGTRMMSAFLMNWGTTTLPGGVLTAKNAKALKIPIPSGQGATKTAKGLHKQHGNFMFRKSVKIPSRRMDLWTDQDDEEISIAAANKITEILNR